MGISPYRYRSLSGRLLSEFLVGLAILFLALAADMAILNKATESTTGAVLSNKALDIAQSGMEEVIANPQLLASGPRSKSFGAGKNGRYEAAFVRKIWQTSLLPVQDDLFRVTVKVEWENGTRSLSLERYVRKH